MTEAIAAGTEFPFFDAHRSELELLFEVLGSDYTFSDQLTDIVDQTQPWVKGDHSRPENTVELSEQQRSNLWPIYEKLGMKEELSLPKGHYDQIIVLGAIAIGTSRRVDFVRRMVEEQGVSTDSIMMLGGQRRIFPERETEDIGNIIDEVQEKDAAGTWLLANCEASDHSWEVNAWETDIMRLSMLAKLGSLPIRQLHLRLGNSDPIRRYEFDWNGIPVSLLHSLATPRDNGAPRHTTESCIQDWINTEQPNHGARIGFVGANPHLLRMGRSAQRTVDGMGRQDIDLVVSGPAAPNARDSIYLGEIARSLYEDLQVVAS